MVNQSNNSETLNLPIAFAAGAGLVDTETAAIVLAGNLSGSGGLTKTGSSELILSGTNTYAGGTAVNGGTLEFASSSALPGSGLTTIGAGGRLVSGSGAGIVTLRGINGQWATNGSGTWSASGNWTGGVPGLNAQDTAVFGAALTTGTAAVTLDGSRSLSSLGFSTTGGASYAISPSNGSTLTLADTAGSATISDSGGNHTIAAPIVLGSNLSVSVTTGSALTIAGGISQSGGSYVAERQRRRGVDPQRHGHLHAAGRTSAAGRSTSPARARCPAADW